MKKYLYFVIPIIILLIIVLSFIWLCPNKKDESSPSMNEVVNQIPDVSDESINAIESEIDSPDVLENKEASEILEESEPEKVDEVTTKENTSKQVSPSSSTSPKTTSTSKKETTTKNTIDTPKKEESKVTVKVEEKEETKPSSTQNTEQSTKKQDSTTSTDNKSQEVKKEETVVRCTINNNHGMGVGNSGKWFETKDEAISYYKSKIKYWDEWWQKADPDDTEADATYYKSCPTGYEIWSCMYCSKWTINFYYR